MDTETLQSNIETEFLEIDSKESWPLLYQHIRNESLNYEYTVLEARKTQNKNLNRYRDVSPYDHSRVVLSKGPCDYINANLLTMDRTHRRYILTQGPLPNTTGHFWLMVWEQNCKAVLMLNRVIEKNQVKCHQYWPLGTQPGQDDVMLLPDVGLKVQYISEKEASYYITRILRLTELESGTSRDILHFHYTTWPDFGVPQSPTAFLDFLMVVREKGALDQNVGPPVVHCSAGIGRSGTFCLVDSCLVLIEETGLNSVNVREVLLEMRRFRMGLIQTPDQLRFSYLAIIEGAKKYITAGHSLENNCSSDKTLDLSSIIANHEPDEPPPLPPRDESLTTRGSDNHVEHVSSEEVRPPDKPLPPLPTERLNRPLPSEPSSSDDEDSSKPTSPSPESHLDSGRAIRQRKRVERNENLTQQIREMKRKQQAAENRQQWKRSLFQPFNIGLGVGVLLLGGGVLAYSYFSNRV